MSFFTLFITVFIWSILLGILYSCSRSRFKWKCVNHTKQTTLEFYHRDWAKVMYDSYQAMGYHCEILPIKYRFGFLWRI